MKKLIIISIFLLLLFNDREIYSQIDSFDIVFDYWTGVCRWYPERIDILKNKWGATAIMIKVNWDDIQPNGPDDAYWSYLDSAITNITDRGLKVYVRIAMGNNMPAWVHVPTIEGLTSDDFQTKSDGSRYFKYDVWGPLNFTSDLSKYYLLNYFSKVVEHLSTAPYAGSVKYVFPSTDVDNEMEYTGEVMLGYSVKEIEKFRNYLRTKYNNDIELLKNKWEAGPDEIQNFADIQPRNYNWNNSAPYSTYIYPKGRVDWINFHTSELKSFIDTCSEIVSHYQSNDSTLKMGVEFGSCYDYAIENRGWYDPTPLIENVEFFKVADIIAYKPNFEFAADYVRSICNFWSTIKNKNIKFATETNWPDYDLYSPELLNNDWSTQLTTFYKKGASAHLIYGMDWIIATKLSVLRNDEFKIWGDTLQFYSKAKIKTITNTKAVHLSCEQGNFEGNNYTEELIGEILYLTFNFLKSISPQGNYWNNLNNYDDHCDIVTNCMINNYPQYINKYSNLYFTKSSRYIPDETYLLLMTQNLISVPLDNATAWPKYSEHGMFEYTQGLKNEYNENRSPIHLIWKSRADLQLIWPDANLPDPNSGYTEDFIYWCEHTGSQHSGEPEYPEWEIIDGNGLYKYDKNIRAVWDSRQDLQMYYPDGHHCIFPKLYSVNMTSWAKEQGYMEDPQLYWHQFWPNVGGIIFPNKLNKQSQVEFNKLPKKFSLSQNYPNPFNPITKIKYDIPKISNVFIKVYDIIGREIISLVNEIKQPGYYEIMFDGTNYASGVYFYTISAGNYYNVKKMVLLK